MPGAQAGEPAEPAAAPAPELLGSIVCREPQHYPHTQTNT